MASRIIYQGEGLQLSKSTKAVKRPAYQAWIATLPCIVTRRTDVQAAHLSFARPDLGHFGRGKGQKASDRWVLPLCVDQHFLQHQGNEEAYWRRLEIDPHLACLILWGLYSELGADATEHATKIIMKEIGR